MRKRSGDLAAHGIVPASANRERMRGMKRICLCLLLLSVLLGTAGCRERIHSEQRQAGTGEQTGQAAGSGGGTRQSSPEDSSAGEWAESADSRQMDEPDGESETKENPESSRKEYDASADAEIRGGEPNRIQLEGNGSGFYEYASDALGAVSRVKDEAEKSATQLSWVEESDRISASDSGDTAESALQYYSLLLAERTETIFECKRKYCYLEMPEKYVTIHKSSQMHALITKAGMYSVSARLRENDLTVDAGWIVRKNPDMIVKIVPANSFKSGFGNAGQILQEIRHRDGMQDTNAVRSGLILGLSADVFEDPYLECAGALVLASHAYPELFEDVDLSAALGMLRDESGKELTELYIRDGGQE